MKRTIATVLMLGLAVLLLAALVVHVREVPSLSSIKRGFRSDNMTVLDRRGRVIDEIVSKKNMRRLNWVSLDEVAPSFIEAVLANESWRLTTDSITMQLAQARFWPSVALEMVWSQRQILEAYINLSVYRGELQGISAAAQALFDKSPAELTRAQGAVLASLMHAKGKGVDGVQSKACALLRAMNSAEECGLMNASHLANLERSYQVRPFMKMAPHVARVLETNPDLREGNVVRSTLDRDIQWIALNALHKRDMVDGAAVVIENSTGHVLAYVGNSGLSRREGFRDLAAEPRQAGFVLKPFLFAQALDERVLTAATVIDEKPEPIRLRQALQGSLKLPAVYTLELVGVDSFVHSLSQLGFTKLQKAEVYGPSLALGAVDINLLDLANAYRALANKGQWTPYKFASLAFSEEGSRRVFSEGAAYIINVLLQEMGTGMPWSVSYCDQWCVGFSEKYTIAVLGGGKDAWQEILLALHKSEPSQAPPPPAGLQESGGEWFVEGTANEAAILPKPKAGVGSRITYPIDHSRIGIDPARPGESARLFFQVFAPGPDQNLYLNGKRLGRVHALQQWEPVSGGHLLELRDSKGRLLHQVRFTVSGAAADE